MGAAVLFSLALLGQVVGDSTMTGPRQRPRPTDFLPAHHFEPAEVLLTLRQYHDAVSLYRHGRTVEAIDTVRKLPRAHVEFIMEILRRARRGLPVRISKNPTTPMPAWMRSDDQPFKWSRVDLQAAGLLHGDITLSDVDTDDFEGDLRLTLSMLPIADLPPPNGAERPETWTRDWLRAVGGAMLAARRYGPLRVLLAYADLLVSNDGPLLLVRGTLDELQSEATAPPIALSYAEGFARTRRDRDALRDEAIASLTRALKSMPESDEAAVRLAHVRIEMHQAGRATPLLDRVVASERSRWWYVAALMRGGAYETVHDAAAAERLYRAVIDRFPRAQSPYVALATLQYASGRAEEAAATLDRMYARPWSSDSDDPWWQYSTDMGPAAIAALDRMHAAVRQ